MALSILQELSRFYTKLGTQSLLGLSMLDSLIFSDVGYMSILHNESGSNVADSNADS